VPMRLICDLMFATFLPSCWTKRMWAAEEENQRSGSRPRIALHLFTVAARKPKKTLPFLGRFRQLALGLPRGLRGDASTGLALLAVRWAGPESERFLGGGIPRRGR
jgi:hypothetical protein